MSVPARIIDDATGDEAHVFDWFLSKYASVSGGFMLSTGHPRDIFGQFVAASRTTAGTTVITSPLSKGSLILSDIIISTDRVNGATCVIRFNDDIRQINIFRGIATDAPIVVSLSPRGKVRGWADARLELVTTGALDANVTLMYVKAVDALAFDEWDKLR